MDHFCRGNGLVKLIIFFASLSDFSDIEQEIVYTFT